MGAKALRDARQPAPDYAAGTLTVALHRCGSPLQHATIADFCATPDRDGNLFPEDLPPPLLPAAGRTLIPAGGQEVWGYGVFYAVSGRLDHGAFAALLSDGLQAHAGALPQALALDGKMFRHHLGLLTLAQHEDGALQAVAASAVEFPFARGIVVVRSATTGKKKPDRHRDAPRRVERGGGRPHAGAVAVPGARPLGRR